MVVRHHKDEDADCPDCLHSATTEKLYLSRRVRSDSKVGRAIMLSGIWESINFNTIIYYNTLLYQKYKQDMSEVVRRIGPPNPRSSPQIQLPRSGDMPGNSYQCSKSTVLPALLKPVQTVSRKAYAGGDARQAGTAHTVRNGGGRTQPFSTYRNLNPEAQTEPSALNPSEVYCGMPKYSYLVSCKNLCRINMLGRGGGLSYDGI